MRIDKFKEGFDEVLSDPPLGDEVHYGEKQEGLVRRSMVAERRIPVPAPVGPKRCEHLDVLLKHLSE